MLAGQLGLDPAAAAALLGSKTPAAPASKAPLRRQAAPLSPPPEPSLAGSETAAPLDSTLLPPPPPPQLDSAVAAISLAEHEALIAAVRAEKTAEVAALVDKLRTEYDAQLAELQAQFSSQEMGELELEQAFDNLTGRFEAATQELHANAAQEVAREVEVREKLTLHQKSSQARPSSAPLASEGVKSKIPRSIDVKRELVSKPNLDGDPNLSVCAGATPIAVLGPGRIPVVALPATDGTPLRTIMDAGGALHAATDSRGYYIPVRGPEGQLALKLDLSVLSEPSQPQRPPSPPLQAMGPTRPAMVQGTAGPVPVRNVCG
jgi:hypothetical protein